MAPLIIALHPQMTFIVKIGHFCYWTPRLMSDCVNIFYLTSYIFRKIQYIYKNFERRKVLNYLSLLNWLNMTYFWLMGEIYAIYVIPRRFRLVQYLRLVICLIISLTNILATYKSGRKVGKLREYGYISHRGH